MSMRVLMLNVFALEVGLFTGTRSPCTDNRTDGMLVFANEAKSEQC